MLPHGGVWWKVLERASCCFSHLDLQMRSCGQREMRPFPPTLRISLLGFYVRAQWTGWGLVSPWGSFTQDPGYQAEWRELGF